MMKGILAISLTGGKEGELWQLVSKRLLSPFVVS